MRRISVKDITKALKMRYVANMSLRDIATAIKFPHTTIADYAYIGELGHQIRNYLATLVKNIFRICIVTQSVQVLSKNHS